MQDSFLTHLRCPLDPDRDATLTRDHQTLVCDRCRTRFPIKQGVPILTPGEADLPPPLRHIEDLPCHGGPK